MISGVASSSCFPNVSQQVLQMYPHHHHHQHAAEDVISSSLDQACSSGVGEAHSNSFLYNLSLLKDKVHQVQSLLGILIATDQSQPHESTSIALANMGGIVKEIIVTASSILFTCQQMAVGANSSSNITNDPLQQSRGKLQDFGLSSQRNYVADHVLIGQEKGQSFFSSTETFDWYGDNNYNSCCNNNTNNDNNRGMNLSGNNTLQRRGLSQEGEKIGQVLKGKSPKNYDVIELDAADLLAKYTHYCQVCGKGFKRDANLRMHMRAHGDEYKTSAALSNPMKNNSAIATGDEDSSMKLARKYSCPHEGCRWNQKHAKFQPLKSMICVKNHYKRSHCPKMYVCKRCNRKQFSVLSDLRTHEKHCGDLKWQCSCGTTFSRKDKLMGHVALFVGHTPAITSSTTKIAADIKNQVMPMQLDDRV